MSPGPRPCAFCPPSPPSHPLHPATLFTLSLTVQLLSLCVDLLLTLGGPLPGVRECWGVVLPVILSGASIPRRFGSQATWRHVQTTRTRPVLSRHHSQPQSCWAGPAPLRRPLILGGAGLGRGLKVVHMAWPTLGRRLRPSLHPATAQPPSLG